MGWDEELATTRSGGQSCAPLLNCDCMCPLAILRRVIRATQRTSGNREIAAGPPRARTGGFWDKEKRSYHPGSGQTALAPRRGTDYIQDRTPDLQGDHDGKTGISRRDARLPTCRAAGTKKRQGGQKISKRHIVIILK